MLWYELFLQLKEQGRCPSIRIVDTHFSATVYNQETQRIHYSDVFPSPEEALHHALISDQTSPVVADPSNPQLGFRREPYYDHVSITLTPYAWELTLPHPAEQEHVRNAVADLFRHVQTLIEQGRLK